MSERSWRVLLVEVEAALHDAGFESAQAEAQWLLQRVSGYGPAELARGGDEIATEVALAHLNRMVDERRAGRPLQYVLGMWSFRGLDLFVDPRVLVPRPETEIVAGYAIDELLRQRRTVRAQRESRGSARPLVAADLGTGSGAIALALAHEVDRVEVWATDVSEDALAVARSNVAGMGSVATRIRLAQGSWFDALPGELCGRLDLVVSNPPYIAESEATDLPSDVLDHEPHLALFSGPTGLDALRTIVAGAGAWLAPGGSLVCELARHQGDRVRQLAVEHGFSDAVIRVDLTGRDRVLVARRN